MSDHLPILRRQILTLTAGPTTRDELLANLPLVGDAQSRDEARASIDTLVELGYLRAWQYEGTPWVHRTEAASRQIKRMSTTLDPAIWGAIAFSQGGAS